MGTRVFESRDLAGDVEVIRLCSEACFRHWRRAGRERPFAMQHEVDAFRSAAQGFGAVQCELGAAPRVRSPARPAFRIAPGETGRNPRAAASRTINSPV